MAEQNGKPRTMVRLEVLILILQIMVGALGGMIWNDIRIVTSEVAGQERRIDALEQFAARGDRWSLSDQMRHESEIGAKLNEIIRGQEKIKAKLGIE